MSLLHCGRPGFDESRCNATWSLCPYTGTRTKTTFLAPPERLQARMSYYCHPIAKPRATWSETMELSRQSSQRLATTFEQKGHKEICIQRSCVHLLCSRTFRKVPALRLVKLLATLVEIPDDVLDVGMWQVHSCTLQPLHILRAALFLVPHFVCIVLGRPSNGRIGVGVPTPHVSDRYMHQRHTLL